MKKAGRTGRDYYLKRRPENQPSRLENRIELPKIRRSLEAWPPGALLSSDQDYFALAATAVNLGTPVVARVTFSEVRFEKVDLSGTCLKRVSVVDACLDECNLANSVWEEAEWQRVILSGGRLLLGLRCNDSVLGNLLVRDCNLKLSQFRYSRFQRARFERCTFAGADFQGADLQNAVFDDCDLEAVNFSGCKLVGAEVHTSDISGIQIQAPSLQGLVVRPDQAVHLASVVGLVVRPG